MQDKVSEKQFFLQGDLNIIGVKETDDGSHSRIFPVISSAMLLTGNNWEAIGGIPVRVNTRGRVSGNTLSTSPLNLTGNPALGEQKYLILGLKMEERNNQY